MSAPSSLVYLKGEHNINTWEQGLEAELDSLGLSKFIFAKNPPAEPDEDTEPEKHEAWFMKRASAMKVLLATLKDESVITTLTVNGWDMKNKDPKALFNLIQSCIARLTNEARTEVLHAFMTIRRSNFDSLGSFLNQYTKLRKRVHDAKYEFTDDVEVGHLYNAKMPIPSTLDTGRRPWRISR
ncbi:hypothetical protein QBC32DRAFT_380245 [Pseudoneurospora amorphoporcata]|uniref:Uncharacterized protein n=1 Tax=Pseudoneurospora amorphoporcata TaxID=241081 RepID=A0AAN6SCP2_9PEZI|nr:hypothetical protein QBC32DRAFT_380245 [Pseudoneurospora amorphoporcata]